MSLSQSPKIVKLGEILPSLGSYESILASIKSYPLWPSLIREALVDRALEGITCGDEEMQSYWESWCKSHGVDPSMPFYEGLSPGEMRLAARREGAVEKFKREHFTKLLPEYFCLRKAALDLVTLEFALFDDAARADEAVFRCRGREQSLEEAARELGHREDGGPALRRIGPVSFNALDPALASLIADADPGCLLGPKKIGHAHIVARLIEIREATLDESLERRLLDEMFEQWVEQQMASIIGKPMSEV